MFCPEKTTVFFFHFILSKKSGGCYPHLGCDCVSKSDTTDTVLSHEKPSGTTQFADIPLNYFPSQNRRTRAWLSPWFVLTKLCQYPGSQLAQPVTDSESVWIYGVNLISRFHLGQVQVETLWTTEMSKYWWSFPKLLLLWGLFQVAFPNSFCNVTIGVLKLLIESTLW